MMSRVAARQRGAVLQHTTRLKWDRRPRVRKMQAMEVQTTVGIPFLIQQHPPRMAGCLVHGKEYEGSLAIDLLMGIYLTGSIT